MLAAPKSDAYCEGLELSAAGRHSEAIAKFEAALAERPTDTRVLFALGNTAGALNLREAAEHFYRMVLALEPGRVEACVNLANLLRADGRPESAIALLEPVILHAPESAEVRLGLGSAHRELGDRSAAQMHYRAALALRSDYLQAIVNLADILCDDGARDEALALYDRALALEPGNAGARFHRGLVRLENGDLANGWPDYDARLSLSPIRHEPSLPRWRGRERETVLVTAEQGVGDELMFSGMIADLAGRCTVILECDKRLVPLFARSFAGVRVRPSNIKNVGGAICAFHEPSDADSMVAIGSLALQFRNALADFPKHAWLIPDAEDTRIWRRLFSGNGPYIGLCWRSGKRDNGRALQYAPLEDWAAFIRALPGTPVCVQYDADAEDIAALEQASGRQILVPQELDQKNELDRTCAMLSALDCVVSAPTAVSWLAAGAGVPVLKLLYRRSWTSFGTGYEPFAPSCRQIASAMPGDWHQTFALALQALRRL